MIFMSVFQCLSVVLGLIVDCVVVGRKTYFRFA